MAVFGADDRVATPPHLQSVADRVGLLVDLERKTVCTAFCIDRAMVATAAHCLFPPGVKRAVRSEAIRFRMSLAGAREEARIAGVANGTADLSIATGSRRLRLRPPIDAISDWALIRLDREVCRAGGLAISRRTTNEVLALAREGRVYHVAFHRDFGDFTRALGAPCDAARSFPGAGWETIARDFRRPEDVVLHTCDTGGSSSGSPLLVDGRDGPEVVALNVGTYLHANLATPDRERTSARAATSAARPIANTAIAAHAFADAAAAFTSAGPLSSRRSVRALQAMLRRQGAYHGPINGQADERLAAAISAYEAGLGWPPTGLATERLRRHLEAMPPR